MAPPAKQVPRLTLGMTARAQLGFIPRGVFVIADRLDDGAVCDEARLVLICHPERESRDLGLGGTRHMHGATATQVPRLTLGMTARAQLGFVSRGVFVIADRVQCIDERR
jgi:hypothetical protein